MTFGEKIKNRRKYLNMTQQELADKIGVSRRVIIAYEKDTSSPRTNADYEKLASALEVNINFLLVVDSLCSPIQMNFTELMNNLSYYNSDFLLDNKQLKIWEKMLRYLDGNCPSLTVEDRICISNCLGYIQYLYGGYDAALCQYEESITRLVQVSPDWNAYFLESIGNTGKRPEMPKMQKVPDFASLFGYLYILGDTYYRKGRVSVRVRDYENAEKCLLLAHGIISFLQENEEIDSGEAEKNDWVEQYLLETYNGLALVNRYKEDFSLAKSYINHALRDRLRFDNPSKSMIGEPRIEWEGLQCTERTAEYFNTLGQIYMGIGRKKGAEDEKAIREGIECFEIAQAVRNRMYDRNSALSEIYNNLGKAYELLIQFAQEPDIDKKRQEFFARAYEYHQKALEYRLRPDYTNVLRLATTYKNLGSLYKTMGKWTQSLENYQKCLSIRRKQYSEDAEQVREIKDIIEEIQNEK